MSNVSQWSTTAASNNSAAPDGAPEGMAPSGLNDSMREIMAALAKWYSDTDGTLTTAGSSNAFTLTTNNAHAALADQSTIVCRMDRAPTGAATLNVDALGAKSIVVNHDEAVTSTTWEADQMAVFIYNATDDVYEMVGPSVAIDGSITTAKLAAGAVTTAKVTSVPYPRAYLGGLQLSNDTDASHDISIAVGVARDAANSFNFDLSSAMVKRIDANWTAGTGNGGFPSALTIANDTWYHVFLVDDGSEGTDAGFDTSLTATNLLSDSGGTKYRRIGSILTDGSSNIIAFTQRGDVIYWDAASLSEDEWSLSTTEATATLEVPPDVEVEAIISGYSQNQDAGEIIYLYSPLITAATISGSSGPAHSGYNNDTDGSFASSIPPTKILTNTSKQIHGKSTATCTLDLWTIGWRDFLGRYD